MNFEINNFSIQNSHKIHGKCKQALILKVVVLVLSHPSKVVLESESNSGKESRTDKQTHHKGFKAHFVDESSVQHQYRSSRICPWGRSRCECYHPQRWNSPHHCDKKKQDRDCQNTSEQRCRCEYRKQVRYKTCGSGHFARPHGHRSSFVRKNNAQNTEITFRVSIVRKEISIQICKLSNIFEIIVRRWGIITLTWKQLFAEKERRTVRSSPWSSWELERVAEKEHRFQGCSHGREKFPPRRTSAPKPKTRKTWHFGSESGEKWCHQKIRIQTQKWRSLSYVIIYLLRS